MSSKLEPTSIEKKKQDNGIETDPVGKASNFFQSLLNKFINLILLILMGSIILYGTRVAQANVLPTDFNCFPYTDTMAQVKEVIVNTDIIKSKGGKFSVKLRFPSGPDDSNTTILKSGLIAYFRNLKQSPDAISIYLYIATILHSLISVNLSLLNTVYNMMNGGLTETLIIFLSPLIIFILLFMLFFGNNFYLVYLFFYNTWLFYCDKTMVNEKATWAQTEENGMWTSGWFIRSLCIVFGVWFFLSTVGMLLLPILSIFAVVYSFILPIFMEAEIIPSDASASKKKTAYTYKNMLINILKYKMNILMYIISFIVVLDAYSNLGTYECMAAILVCILLYFFKPEIYTSYTPKPNDPFTPDFSPSVQASRDCIPGDTATPAPDGEEGGEEEKGGDKEPSAPPLVEGEGEEGGEPPVVEGALIDKVPGTVVEINDKSDPEAVQGTVISTNGEPVNTSVGTPIKEEAIPTALGKVGGRKTKKSRK